MNEAQCGREETTRIGKLWEKIYQKWPDEKKKSRVIRETDGKITNFWEEGSPPHKVTIFVSTENITAGVYVLTPGAWSPESHHKGDEYYYVLEGVLTITINDTDSYDVREREGFLIAANDKHQTFNFTEKICRVAYTIGGGL